MIYPEYPQNLPGRETDYQIKGIFYRKVNAFLEKITGYQGCFSFWNTRGVIRHLRRIQPDIIHLHNIHGMKINYGKLFSYFKNSKIIVVWTLHDCWPFTGQCPHFSMVGCNRWKDGCHHCTQYRQYPAVYVDRTKAMWKLKKKWFTGLENMTVVTPSCWLAQLVKESYLSQYPVVTIYNGIDRTIFKPTVGNLKEHYHLYDKYIVLGVAFGWGEKKGLDVLVELSRKLSNEYQIVLVGTNAIVDKQLPPNILSIHRMQNQTELAAIYSSADVFVNATREEVLGLVNIEALACGTPVITFRTGGSPECIDETCGAVVDVDDIDAMQSEIERICTTKPYSTEACLRKSREFDKNERYNEYLKLYETVLMNRGDKSNECKELK